MTRRAHQGGIAGLIVGRRDLHDIAADQIQAAQPTQQALRLERRDAADLGRAGAGCVDRVEPIDIE